MAVPLAPTGVTVTNVAQTGFTLTWIAAFDPITPETASQTEIPTNVLARIDSDRQLDVRFDPTSELLANYQIYVNGTLLAAIAAGQPTATTIQLTAPRVGDSYTVEVTAALDGKESAKSIPSTATVPINATVRQQDVVMHAEAVKRTQIYPGYASTIRLGINWAGREAEQPFTTDFSLKEGSVIFAPMQQNGWMSGALFTRCSQPFTVNAQAYFANGTTMRREIVVTPQNA